MSGNVGQQKIRYLLTEQSLLIRLSLNTRISLQMHLNPSNTIFDAKRLIGRDFAEKAVQEDIINMHWPFLVRGNETGRPYFAGEQCYHSTVSKLLVASEALQDPPHACHVHLIRFQLLHIKSLPLPSIAAGKTFYTINVCCCLWHGSSAGHGTSPTSPLNHP